MGCRRRLLDTAWELKFVYYGVTNDKPFREKLKRIALNFVYTICDKIWNLKRQIKNVSWGLKNVNLRYQLLFAERSV